MVIQLIWRLTAQLRAITGNAQVIVLGMMLVMNGQKKMEYRTQVTVEENQSLLSKVVKHMQTKTTNNYLHQLTVPALPVYGL